MATFTMKDEGYGIVVSSSEGFTVKYCMHIREGGVLYEESNHSLGLELTYTMEYSGELDAEDCTKSLTVYVPETLHWSGGRQEGITDADAERILRNIRLALEFLNHTVDYQYVTK